MNIFKKLFSDSSSESKRPSKVYKLEFRKKDGTLGFLVRGEVAQKIFSDLKNSPRYVHKTKTFEGKGEHIVLECIIGDGDCMDYGNEDRTIFGIAWYNEPGDYVKVVY